MKKTACLLPALLIIISLSFIACSGNKQKNKSVDLLRINLLRQFAISDIAEDNNFL